MRPCAVSAITTFGLLLSSGAGAATLTVGSGKTYPTPCAAIAAASAGDIIEIDAGTYAKDVCQWSTDSLTLRGVGGLAKLDADGEHAGGKAIWVIAGDDTVVENIEFTNAAVPDQNGAGIRQEGRNLTVRGCWFHHNENGILTSADSQSEILIEYSQFDHNGRGDGYTHNLYIGHVGKLIFQYNYSHRASIGHLLKSRAAENYVLYNRLTGEDGTQSYEIDIPNGGRSYIIGNLIQQGPSTDNSSMISYEREGAHGDNPNHELFVVNNTFVNERPNGSTFINVDGGVSVPVVVRNNIFVGPGTVCSQSSAVLEGNYVGDAPGFVNQAAFDYHITSGSPCEDTGVAPGTGVGYDLTPMHQYVHPAAEEGRVTVGVIDVGAYEIGGGTSGGGGAAGSGGTAGSAGAAGMGGSSGGGSSGTGGESGTGGASGGNGGSAGSGGASGGAGGGASGSGASGGTGGGASGGTGGGTAGTAGADASGEEDDGGCGCRTHGSSPGDWSAFGLLATAILVLRRRHRA